ncbi:MAG: hypothetical protein MUC63_07385 [Planctomycetes bacterium]|jgi:hypothetical protein|nr:hypothetical protein [Planctomycetota bacterium]
MTRNLTPGNVYFFHVHEYFKYSDPFLSSVIQLRVVEETETGVWTNNPDDPNDDRKYFFPWASILLIAQE